MNKKQVSPLEAIFWSVALPGFGQILNKKFLKGILFILLEFLINIQSNFNAAILYSFLGNITKAIEITDYQWLMFYPCVYMFAIWDAYRDAKQGEVNRFSFFPFVFGAYFLTIGLMYSKNIRIFGVLLGPVFLPMVFLVLGILIGFLIKWYVTGKRNKKTRQH